MLEVIIEGLSHQTDILYKVEKVWMVILLTQTIICDAHYLKCANWAYRNPEVLLDGVW
jgi:hypothetical protein